MIDPRHFIISMCMFMCLMMSVSMTLLAIHEFKNHKNKFKGSANMMMSIGFMYMVFKIWDLL